MRTSSRTRSRAARRPARVLILRHLGMTSDMIKRRRDQVEPGPRSCSSFLAPIGRDRGGTSLLQGLVDIQNALFTWSTSAAADGGQCIKSLIGGFSRFRSDFAFANPGKQAKAPESSGSRSAFFSFPRGLELTGHKTGCDGLEKSPLRRESWAEPGRRPRSLCLTLVPPFQVNIGPLRASFFSGSTPFGPGASKLPESWRSSARP